MKCPLLILGWELCLREVETIKNDCLKEECAWWIPAFKMCAMLDIAINLGTCANELFQIKDKMSHEGQLRAGP